MTQRICSCCGLGYTDESGHDLDRCIEACKYYLHKAEKEYVNARDALERAYDRKIAILKEK